MRAVVWGAVVGMLFLAPSSEACLGRVRPFDPVGTTTAAPLPAARTTRSAAGPVITTATATEAGAAPATASAVPAATTSPALALTSAGSALPASTSGSTSLATTSLTASTSSATSASTTTSTTSTTTTTTTTTTVPSCLGTELTTPSIPLDHAMSISVGTSVTVEGTANANFYLAFVTGPSYASDNVALFFEPRINSQFSVLNSRLPGWGAEVRAPVPAGPSHPFAYGVPFSFTVTVTAAGYDVSVGGAFHATMAHRTAFGGVTHLHIDSRTVGQLSLSSVCLA